MDPILKILRRSQEIVVEGEWAFNKKASYVLPKQGWKLHISATLLSAPVVLKRCLPCLLRKEVHFKIVPNIFKLDKLNQGKFGLPQMGKFITVYPKSDGHALRLAELLHKATRGLKGPLILSDRPFRKDSLVHYRYGSFTEEAAGKKIKDERLIYFNPPDWVTDPFIKNKSADFQKSKSNLFGGRFLILSCLYQGAGGGVYRALDLGLKKPRQVILKEARKHAVEDLLGRDARKRLRHEALILKKLSDLKSVPTFYKLFQLDGNLYLAREYFAGKSLEHIMADQFKKKKFIPESEIKEFGIKLCEAIEPIHLRGIILRDLKPFHIIISSKGVRIIDFETAYNKTKREIPFTGLSKGFSSPQLAQGWPPSVTDDIYSLGSVLYYMLTNTNPALAPIKRGPRAIYKYNPKVSKKMREVVLTTLHSDLTKRFNSVRELKKALLKV